MTEPVKSAPEAPTAARGSETHLLQLERYADALEAEAESFWRAHATAILFLVTAVIFLTIGLVL